MIDEFEKKRLCKIFGTRIGLALCRSGITYGDLYVWYMNDVLISKVKKIRGIGKLSALIIRNKLENYLFTCL